MWGHGLLPWLRFPFRPLFHILDRKVAGAGGSVPDRCGWVGDRVQCNRPRSPPGSQHEMRQAWPLSGCKGQGPHDLDAPGAELFGRGLAGSRIRAVRSLQGETHRGLRGPGWGSETCVSAVTFRLAQVLVRHVQGGSNIRSPESQLTPPTCVPEGGAGPLRGHCL